MAVGLLDIAPITQIVVVGDKRIPVGGITARGLALLLVRFPSIVGMMRSKKFDAAELFRIAPDAVSAIIAAGVGFPDDVEQEAACDRLPVGIQTDLLDSILRLTMPGGLLPFVNKIASLVGGLDGKSGDEILGDAIAEPESLKSTLPLRSIG